jgi:5'-3' exonuclease
LSGKVTIDKFVIDENCSEINVPYTPFQQLFSIMPIKSISLLPASYGPIAKNELKEYFPLDFDIDLNGRALPWEAACLIPFCDEKIFIEMETQLLTTNPLSTEEKNRNQIYFFFKSFKYDSMIK